MQPYFTHQDILYGNQFFAATVISKVASLDVPQVKYSSNEDLRKKNAALLPALNARVAETATAAKHSLELDRRD